ncbi:zinc-binding dehydrogenase [Plantactinospora sp. B6F1]|uniref:zinc-binding dehydrogenase n=1 Tax=Plantactinospora sp. B6F1 TaxID=3158971 RepID=UPI00102C0489
MRAVWLREFGGPERLLAAETPDPSAGPGQVVVAVEFANVTFVETQLRAGTGPFPVRLPTIPGNGVGGVVAEVGPEVDPALRGRRVVTSTGGAGGYADRVAVDADGLVAVPDELPMESAVALLADGRTALLLLETAGVHPGERILVEAAAGGVGSLLVQLAGAAGATVVAVAGGDRKVALARDLGADLAVDYSTADWPARVRAGVGGIDVVFDGVGGTVGRSAFDLLDRGGRMVSFGLSSGSWTQVPDEVARERGVTVVRSLTRSPEQLRELTRRALAEAAAGRLRPVIGQRFPLDRAADAHAAIQSRRTVGKTLLDAGRPTGTRPDR